MDQETRDAPVGAEVRRTVTDVDAGAMENEAPPEGAPRKRLVGSLVRVRDFSAADRDVAYELLHAYYENTDRARFDRDLAEKQYIVCMRDSKTGELKGFCTIHVGVMRVGRRKVTTTFTGDTVVDREYWGQKIIHTQFSKLLLYLKVRYPLRPLYWFLISKGYKTYKIIVNTCKCTIPAHDRPTPAGQQALLHELARARFGDSYDEARGVIHAEYGEHVR
jgi:hypothetical protein